MTYIPLSLKYRPQKFDEVVGQEHITTTLKNAIALGKVAHAYLFSGPRGTGKTSIARIFAKSLNCKDARDASPCNKCSTCVEISEGRNLDVLEIDGASNRGIDEIRNLRENVKFAPTEGKYKIYIIDEVHMLTDQAFNALLKTLEEPPAHVKFIFATTRSYKVLPTITSRCQKFDFKRLSARAIAERLKAISEKEKIDVTEEALQLIAKSADGSMRDGQVILDQMNAFSKAKISPADVTDLLGVIPQDAFFGLTDHIASKDAPAALRAVAGLIDSGKDALAVTLGLVGHFRNMMVSKLSKDSSEHIALSDDDMKRLKEQAQAFSVDDILYIIYTFANTIELIRKTSLTRVPLEVALIKVIRMDSIKPVKELLEQVSRLEGLSRVPKSIPVTEAPAKKNPSPAPEAALPKNTATAVLNAAPEGAGLFQEIKSRWYEVMNCIKNKKMSVASYLAKASPVSLEDNRLIIGFGREDNFHKESLETEVNKKVIQDSILEIIQKEVAVGFTTLEYVSEEDPALAGADRNGLNGSNADFNMQSNQSKKIEPIVESALDMFDGKLIRRTEK